MNVQESFAEVKFSYILQQQHQSLPSSLTAIFLDKKMDARKLTSLIEEALGGVAKKLTVMLWSESGDLGTLGSDFHYLQNSGLSESLTFSDAMKQALLASGATDRVLAFLEDEKERKPPTSQELLNVLSRREDLVIQKKIGCVVLSQKYASHLAETGQSPGRDNARKNGFTIAPMSIPGMILEPGEAIRQYSTLIKFLFVGASGALVQLLSLTILNSFFFSGFPNGIYVAEPISIELSIISNFILNDTFTFSGKNQSSKLVVKKGGRFRRFGKYNLISLGSFLVNYAVFSILYSHGLWYVWSNLVAIFAGFVLNYFGSSRWAWQSARARDSTPND